MKAGWGKLGTRARVNLVQRWSLQRMPADERLGRLALFADENPDIKVLVGRWAHQTWNVSDKKGTSFRGQSFLVTYQGEWSELGLATELFRDDISFLPQRAVQAGVDISLDPEEDIKRERAAAEAVSGTFSGDCSSSRAGW